MSAISKHGSLKGLSSLEALREVIVSLHSEFTAAFKDSGSVFPVDSVDELTVGLVRQNDAIIEIIEAIMNELSLTVDGRDDALAQIDAIFKQAETAISTNITKTFGHR